MVEKNRYVSVMLESLQKKDAILDAIMEKNKEQTQVIRQEQLDLELFGKTVEEKDALVQRLVALDDGFQTLYDRVKEELNAARGNYKQEIKAMQQMIGRITEKSMSIQAEEERNRLTIQSHFAKMKQEVRQAKKSNQVASDYYKSMSKLTVLESQFMDQKK